MEFKEINHFLMNHTDEKWFDADKELYKKIFPASKLLPDLELAGKYNKKELDERMCYELMNSAVCDCTIWEGRGFTKDKDNFIVPLKKVGELNEFETELLAIDLDGKHKYNVLKTLVFGLLLPTSDNKGDTYLAALKAKKAELLLTAASLTEEQVESGLESEKDQDNGYPDSSTESTMTELNTIGQGTDASTNNIEEGQGTTTTEPIKEEVKGTDVVDPVKEVVKGTDTVIPGSKEKKSGDQEQNTQV